MTTAQHARRLAVLMVAAAALLWWLTAHTDVFFADGLRYIAQAKAIDQGAWVKGLVRSVDHPIYPMAIAAAHRLIGGVEPRDWQTAAQAAAAVSGVLLVIPIYLVSLEIFGASTAWLACVLLYLLPFNGHVLADALSESTFLLFWTWGLWSALKFLRGGGLLWLPLVIALSVVAYLTRPEGLILPVALLATLVMLAFFPSSDVPRAKRWSAIAVLLVGPVLVAGPFMIIKGGISTKPSILRILGMGPAAPALAVERERPLDPQQTAVKTAAIAARAAFRALDGATNLPLLLLAPLGVAAIPSRVRGKYGLLLGTIAGLATFAMVRLHAMSGYCTPRHAMVVSWILIPASAAGLNWLAEALTRTINRRINQPMSRSRLEAAIKFAFVGCCLTLWGPAAVSPIDQGFRGYRQAGEWLASHARSGEAMVDPKGFSLFYAGKPGYTFATLGDGVRDPRVRWVIAHEALIHGPWDYSKAIRNMVGDRRPIRVFPEKPLHRVSKVYVYDLAGPGDKTLVAAPQPSISHR